jgi:cell division septation protein DedD
LQEQLKERLTGAAILVVIVVFAVPEMFHGRPQPLHGAAAAVDAAIPLRTYTIDLRETPAAQALPPAQADNADAAAPTDGAAPQDGAVLVPAPAVPVPAAASPSGVATGIIQRAEPQLAPPEPKAVAEEPRPVAAQPRPAPRAAPAAAAAAAPAAPESGWAVQVGSFSRKELAERMTRQVRAKGFPVQMVGPDARGLYRVRSTLLPERAAALALREKMVEKGYKPIINASP